MTTLKEFFGNRITTALSHKSDGPVNFVGHESFDGERRANRMSFLKRELGLKIEDTVIPKLSHGKTVMYVSDHNPILEMVQADGIMTDKKRLALTMGFGDCPTLFIYDPVNEVIALAHCGWKGIVAGIIESTLRGMKQEYNCLPKNLKCYIGPGICGPCFEIGREVAFQLGMTNPLEKECFSLRSVINSRLLALGVTDLLFSDDCTKHTTYKNKKGEDVPKYHSFRRDKSDPLQTGMAVMMMN